MRAKLLFLLVFFAASVSQAFHKHEKDFRLRIAREELEKPFLAHRAITLTSGGYFFGTLAVPKMLTLQSQILYLEIDDRQVRLMESCEGAQVSRSHDCRLPIVSLPIVSQDDKFVVMDFEPFFRDFDVSNQVSQTCDVVPTSKPVTSLRDFFLRSVVPADSSITFQLLGNLSQRSLLGQKNKQPVDMRVIFEPIERSEGFSPEVAPRGDGRPYFVTKPLLELELGTTKRHMLRMESSRARPFYISHRVPDKYRAAFRAGIEYWNHVAGRQIFEVQVAESKDQAFQPGTSFADWVENDQLRGAYAQVFSNPFTGEIRYGHVYFPSGVVRHGDLVLRRHGVSQDATPPKGTDTTVDCGLESSGIAKWLGRLRATPGVSADAVAKLEGFLVASTIAHEVGHTLGLRHNFAAHLGSQVTPAQIEKALHLLVKDPEGAVSVGHHLSSVMSYPDVRVDFLVGRDIMAGKTFPFDEAVFAYGYGEGPAPRLGQDIKMTACHEAHLDKYADCRYWPSSPNVFVDAVQSFHDAVLDFPSALMERFVVAKSSRSVSERQEIENVSLDLSSYVRTCVGKFGTLLLLFEQDKPFLAVDHRFPVVDDSNRGEVRDARKAHLGKSLDEAGGMLRAVFSIFDKNSRAGSFLPRASLPSIPELPFVDLPEKWDEELLRRFDEALSQMEQDGFVGFDGEKHTLSESELKTIRDRGNAFLKRFSILLVEGLVARLVDAKFVRNIGGYGYLDGVEDALQAVAEKLLLSEDIKSPLILGRVKYSDDRSPMVAVPNFSYEHETRLNAAKLLKSRVGYSPYWGHAHRQQVGGKIAGLVTKRLGISIGDVAPGMMTGTILDWFSKQVEMLKVLGSAGVKAPKTS